MRLTAVAIVMASSLITPALSRAIPQSRDEAAPVARGTAVLSGVVLADDATRAPLRRVRVSINRAQPGVARTVVTDDRGQFVFSELPAGRYALTATKAGFITHTYGASRPGRAGVPVVLADGDRRADLVVPMLRGGVITGRVLNISGEPAPHRYVALLQRKPSPNGKVLVTFTSAAARLGFYGPDTDDRGVYRFYEVPPGEYLVAVGLVTQSSLYTLHQTTDADVARARRLIAEPRSAAPSIPSLFGRRTSDAADAGPVNTIRYAPVYYPGTTNVSQATPVIVRAGEESLGIDVQMQLMRTAAVEGVISAPSGAPPPNLVVQMISRDPQVSGAPLSGGGIVITNGRFKQNGVPPGQYRIEARALSISPGSVEAADAWAAADVDVDGRDITGVSLDLQTGVKVSGRVDVDEADRRSGTPGSVEITFAPETSVPRTWLGAQTVTSRDGRFEMIGLIPGRYRLRAVVAGATKATTSSGGWTFSKATVDGRDVTDAVFEVRPGAPISDLTVTMTRPGTELVGRVLDASGVPTSELSIVAFAKDATSWHWQSRRIHSEHLASDGTFVIHDLPPGDYLIAALRDVEPDEWFDPDLLHQLVPLSIGVRLVQGNTTRQDIKMAIR